MTRPRFTLRTLLIVVAAVGVGLYFRPGQVDPVEIKIGTSKAWVYWNCGPPDIEDQPRRWRYDQPSGEHAVYVVFDPDDYVANVIVWPKRWKL